MSDTYYPHIEDVTEGRVGRQVFAWHDYDSAMQSLRKGEHLYAYINTLYPIMVNVDQVEKFEQYYGTYTQGLFLSFGLYALDENAHQQAQ